MYGDEVSSLEEAASRDERTRAGSDCGGCAGDGRLSERDGSEPEKRELDFFRKAEACAVAQAAYFKWQLTQAYVIALVHQTGMASTGSRSRR
jgi:hypothetical protein